LLLAVAVAVVVAELLVAKYLMVAEVAAQARVEQPIVVPVKMVKMLKGPHPVVAKVVIVELLTEHRSRPQTPLAGKAAMEEAGLSMARLAQGLSVVTEGLLMMTVLAAAVALVLPFVPRVMKTAAAPVAVVAQVLLAAAVAEEQAVPILLTLIPFNHSLVSMTMLARAARVGKEV
jgi:hypothetical protein